MCAAVAASGSHTNQRPSGQRVSVSPLPNCNLRASCPVPSPQDGPNLSSHPGQTQCREAAAWNVQGALPALQEWRALARQGLRAGQATARQNRALLGSHGHGRVAEPPRPAPGGRRGELVVARRCVRRVSGWRRAVPSRVKPHLGRALESGRLTLLDLACVASSWRCIRSVNCSHCTIIAPCGCCAHSEVALGKGWSRTPVQPQAHARVAATLQRRAGRANGAKLVALAGHEALASASLRVSATFSSRKLRALTMRSAFLMLGLAAAAMAACREPRRWRPGEQ